MSIAGGSANALVGSDSLVEGSSEIEWLAVDVGLVHSVHNDELVSTFSLRRLTMLTALARRSRISCIFFLLAVLVHIDTHEPQGGRDLSRRLAHSLNLAPADFAVLTVRPGYVSGRWTYLEARFGFFLGSSQLFLEFVRGWG